MDDLTGWFYPFELSDGTKVECMLPNDVLPLHETRMKALQHYVSKVNQKGTALDIACHQGYFSFELEKHFTTVTGIDRFDDSITKANFIKEDKKSSCDFKHIKLEDYTTPADFVLCYGLLYHVENPIEIFRKIGELSKQSCLIETQIASSSMPHVEDGSYRSIRTPQGTFTLVSDYDDSNIGGLTDLALVPDKNAVMNMLTYLGFNHIEVYEPLPTDYEQFVRQQRIIVYAERKIQ